MTKQKGNPKLSSLLPNPADVTAVATKVDFKHLDKVAIRRVKVRELMQMGYNIPQITLILESGIKIGKGENETTIEVACTDQTVVRDMRYIRAELLAVDEDIPVKRGELLDKLGYLYNQAVSNYVDAKGAIKNSFLNTALNVVNKIMEVEGVRSPENLNINLSAEAKVAQFSADISKLNEDDKSIILGAIRKVRERRFDEGLGGDGVPNKEPEVRAPSSDNEKVSGEQELRK